jgi:hypothetical protein
MRTVVAVMICIFGFASVSHAARKASPSIFGSHNQQAAFCSVVNGGTTAVTVTVKILNESGGVEHSITETIAPGDIRTAARSISSGVAYACAITSPASLTNVRATMMIMELYTNDSGLSAFRPVRTAALR